MRDDLVIAALVPSKPFVLPVLSLLRFVATRAIRFRGIIIAELKKRASAKLSDTITTKNTAAIARVTTTSALSALTFATRLHSNINHIPPQDVAAKIVHTSDSSSCRDRTHVTVAEDALLRDCVPVSSPESCDSNGRPISLLIDLIRVITLPMMLISDFTEAWDCADLGGALNGLLRPLRALQGLQGPYKALKALKSLLRPLRAL